MNSYELYAALRKWYEDEVAGRFVTVDFGAENQERENVAWVSIDSANTVSAVKLWSTGDCFF